MRLTRFNIVIFIGFLAIIGVIIMQLLLLNKALRFEKKELESAKKEKIDGAIATEYQQLMSALQRSEEAQLNQNQKEIKHLILDEIIKRYQYKEGLYQYYIKNNLEVKKAVSILGNSSEYNKILKK